MPWIVCDVCGAQAESKPWDEIERYPDTDEVVRCCGGLDCREAIRELFRTPEESARREEELDRWVEECARREGVA
ncbi:MAG: hypothetical protein JO085_09605 [Acidimicrobiia bacterium]|nr:hypothetical protein [Acidimicrobiia bacterium]